MNECVSNSLPERLLRDKGFRHPHGAYYLLANAVFVEHGKRLLHLRENRTPPLERSAREDLADAAAEAHNVRPDELVVVRQQRSGIVVHTRG